MRVTWRRHRIRARWAWRRSIHAHAPHLHVAALCRPLQPMNARERQHLALVPSAKPRYLTTRRAALELRKAAHLRKAEHSQTRKRQYAPCVDEAERTSGRVAAVGGFLSGSLLSPARQQLLDSRAAAPHSNSERERGQCAHYCVRTAVAVSPLRAVSVFNGHRDAGRCRRDVATCGPDRILSPEQRCCTDSSRVYVVGGKIQPILSRACCLFGWQRRQIVVW